ncbi:MAG: NAD(P)/FAD-dependent oxidoreductase, partial [Flavobacteriaceae bacterium]
MAAASDSGHAPSYYAATAVGMEAHPPLQGSASADVCVIGGGFTGLSAALHLAERGHDVVLIEGRRLGWGATGRNGGQIHSGQRRDQDYLERVAGMEAAQALWAFGEEAKSLI